MEVGWNWMIAGIARESDWRCVELSGMIVGHYRTETNN